MRTDYTRMAYESFNELVNSLVSEKIDFFSNEDIEKQLYELPYPEEYYEYFKRVIYNMQEFNGMDYDSMWKDDAVYKRLGAMQCESAGKGDAKDYARQWKSYLTGEVKQPRRKTIFEFAVVIHMPQGEFLKALARYDGVIVNVHSPEEFLLYYCIQANDERYTLAYYEELLGNYSKKKVEYDETHEEVVLGEESESKEDANYTIMAESFLNSEVWNEMLYQERDEKIIMFLVKNSEKLTDGITRGRNRYSHTYASRIYRMLSYIYVLYGYDEDKTREDDGEITFLDARNVYWYSNLLRPVVNFIFKSHYRNEAKNNPLDEVFEHLANIGTHIDRVGNRVDDTRNRPVNPVKREDVLFLSMLLLCGFLERCAEVMLPLTPEDLPKVFNNNINSKEVCAIDDMLKRWQEDIRFTDWINQPEDYGVEERYEMAKDYLNQCLDAFNLFHIYEPSPVDRLVLLCLMSEEPFDAMAHVFEKWNAIRK